MGTRLNYVPGSSDPIDGAVDTLLAGAGCAATSHTWWSRCCVPSTCPPALVSVYAPGLYPMDFHAVAEAFVDGHWRVVDATLLAPRQTLVRIATGRDAADTAFLDNHGGAISLNKLSVTAVVDGDLPRDSIDQLVRSAETTWAYLRARHPANAIAMPISTMTGPRTDQVVVLLIGLPDTAPKPCSVNRRPASATSTPSARTMALRITSTVARFGPSGSISRR